MDMHKIRNAFENILSKAREKLTPKTAKTAAVTALLLLLAVICIAVLAGAIRQGASNSTAPPVINNPADTTVPSGSTEVDPWATAIHKAELKDILWDLIFPEHTADDNVYMALNTTIKPHRTDDTNFYCFTILHSGYQYQLELYADTGEFSQISLSSPDGEADGYIAEKIAAQIPLLETGSKNQTAETMLYESESGAYYRVTLTDPVTQENTQYDVDARTGAVMDTLQMLSREAAASLALAQLNSDLSASDCYVSPVTQGDKAYYFLSPMEYAPSDAFRTYYYVDAYTGELADPADFSQLTAYNDLFRDTGSWYNRALSCLYETPEDLRLFMLFRNGLPEESRQPTNAEETALKGWIDAGEELIRLPADKINGVLSDYFGITLDDFDETDLSSFVYLPSTDCYYDSVRDPQYTYNFCATSVEEQSDGSIDVYYTVQDSDNIYKVTLMPRDGGYRILSNVTSFIGRETTIKTVLNAHGIYSEEEVADLECVYDDSRENDPRYNITFTKNDHFFDISISAVTGRWAHSYRTPINQESLIVPDKNDIEIIGTTEDGLPIVDNVSANDSAYGFYWDRDGGTVISIHSGTPEFLPIYEETGELTHDGKTHAFSFRWCTNAGEVSIYRIEYGVSPDITVSSIIGNSQYVTIAVHGDYSSVYYYLYDLQTKEIIDLFQSVDTSGFENVFHLKYSPSRESVLVYCDEGIYYLNTVTGAVLSLQDLPEREGDLEIDFVNDELLSLLWIQTGIPQEWYADCLIYDVTDGSLRTLYTDELYGWLYDMGGIETFGRMHVHHHNGGLCIIDCVNGTHASTGISDFSTVHLCTPDTLYIEARTDDTVYLVDPDGTTTPVFCFGQVFFYVP